MEDIATTEVDFPRSLPLLTILAPYVLAERPIFDSNQGLCLTKIANQAPELNQYISIASPLDGRYN